jgi:hypothetical protein
VISSFPKLAPVVLALALAALGNDAAGQPSQPAAPAAASETGAGAKLTAQLDALDAWLGDEENGDKWRRFLHTDELRDELAKGDEADVTAVARALQRFQEKAPGLERAPFAAVRTTLADWLAELKGRYRDDIVGLTRASRSDHVPITAEQFEQVHNDMRTKARALEQALAAAGQVGAGWKKYLGWEMLEPQLGAEPDVDRKSLADLDEVLRRFRTNEPGLELPPFLDTAQAIERYRGLVTWATAAKTRDSRPDYQRLVESLAQQLERHVTRPTTETAWKVGRVLGVIDALGQSGELVEAIHRSYVRPNVRGAVSANFIYRMPNRPVDQVRPLRDCILGTRVLGTTHSLGNIRYELRPSTGTVELMVYLNGEAHSQSRGFHHPVRIRSTSHTDFWAYKQLSFSEERFTSTPAVAWADTDTRIHSITKTGGNFGRRLVEKIAWQRAMEQHGQAERIASEHARQNVLNDFNATVARDLAAARLRYTEKIGAPLVRRGIQLEHLALKSSEQGVRLETIFAGRSQLAAPSEPPLVAPGHDLWGQIHESAVNNYLPLALASARIAQQTADKPAALSGNVPNWLKVMAIKQPQLASGIEKGAEIVEEAQEELEELMPGEPPPPQTPAFKPYSITLNGEAPVSAHFDDGKISIRVRAAELVSEDAEYQNWDFIVTYAITQKDNHVILKRVGDIEVFPTGFDPAWDKRLTAQQSAFRNTLAGNMNARAKAGQSFPPKIPIEPLRLTRFGVLVLKELVADDGWLTVGWQLPPPGSVEALPPTTGESAGVTTEPRQ